MGDTFVLYKNDKVAYIRKYTQIFAIDLEIRKGDNAEKFNERV